MIIYYKPISKGGTMKNKTNELMKQIALYSLSGALIFSIPACNQGRETADEDSLAENGAITEMEELRDENEIDQVRNEGYYTEWDADRNGALNQDEFRESWNTNMEGEAFNDKMFDEWDANRDAALDENEFRGGLWVYYNKDKNEGLNEEEFRGLSRNYYNRRWNTDNAEGLTQDEFQEGWRTNMGEREYNASLYREWDKDGNNILDENEFSTGMFGFWDENDSNLIEENEYQTFGNY